MFDNLILRTDSYKVSHWKQYPPGTTRVYSYFESRGGEFPTSTFFGLQYFLDRYLAGPVIHAGVIDEAAAIFASHFGHSSVFNRAGWEHIAREHGGRLPVVIRAVPEGTTVWNRNVLMTIENTDPRVPWLTNYLETLLVQVWYPTTVCTLSREMKKVWLEYLRRTGDSTQALGESVYKLHDFGYRGSTSPESAALGGAAHLVNFEGTDTLAAIELLRGYYGSQMAGVSIPAAEHSTVTAWGRDREAEAYKHIVQAFPGLPMVAVVSDSYDIFAAVSQIWGKELRQMVLEREGTVVIRPDSGKPDEVVLSVLARLWESFGGTTNAKGFKVLDPHVRVIQGDGIDRISQRQILEAMAASGWAATNLAMGSGGGLLQQCTRDTQRFAFKTSAVEIDGAWLNVSKAPVTDPGKRSKDGRLKLLHEDGAWTTVPETVPGEDRLGEVFRDGSLLGHPNVFGVVRRRAAEGL